MFKDEGVRWPPVFKSVGSGCSWLCSLIHPLPLFQPSMPIHHPPQFNSNRQHNTQRGLPFINPFAEMPVMKCNEYQLGRK